MPNIHTKSFGPGSLESITIKTWVTKQEGGARKYKARIEGAFTVYCGSGWEHTVDVDETLGGWDSESHEDVQTIVAIDKGENDGHDFVSMVIHDYALEGWEDPCEDGWDEEEL